MPATPLPTPPEKAAGVSGRGPLNALENASSAAILRVLRVTLHTGFALLLAVGLVRMLMAGGALRWVWASAAVVLAAVYLAGTVLEKRHAEGRTVVDPRRYGLLWLGLVTALWVFLLAGSADFAWLAFPIFFLHLHLLPRRAALLTIALMTVAVIASQWAASGAPVPHAAAVVGPVLGAIFSVITGLAYAALYREAENQRRAADELRRTREELARSQHQAGVLAERERLAREIHDTLAQGLSSIVLLGRAAGQSLADGDLATASGRLALVQQTAADNLAEARSFVRGLSSPQLEGTTLVEALGRLCERTWTDAEAAGAPLHCRLEVDGEPQDLPQPVRVALLRAAQASLANVREHARASTAVVSLAFLGSEVTMDVYDDGTGFDPPDRESAAGAADGSGFGLRSLRERVAALNGTLAVESAPGEGTVVAIRLPVEEP
ncbi:sensor histidine kinase [Pseudarthrobacter sp902506025]|uniref:Oxygen sensor histidine kinase NreB n=1 Tax=Pseudarthrobacter defluvii TaxID=410837 RepID=A0ABT9ULB8_9MICC|nr:sensor histidine kinase [Pseudarthrobacter defluvii]MDQ0119738.1 signal transduction histidine kinase [Pseudarthrobacter defluvii]